MGREAFPHRLTDQQLKVLELLSMDTGSTNRWLTQRLKKMEREEGNVHTDVTKPLVDCNILYQVKGEYPNKPLYINKSMKVMNKIHHALVDPAEGRLWYYDTIHRDEHKKNSSTSDKHAEVHSLLISFIHLYVWCDKIIKEIDDVVQAHGLRYDSFCLLTPKTRCKLCREIQSQKKIEQYYQEKQRVSFQREIFLAKIKAQVLHGIGNLGEIQLAKL